MAVTPLKGKAVVGQSGGCTAVINQSLAGVVDAALHSRSITHIWGANHAVQGILNGDFTDLSRQPKRLLQTNRMLPSAALGSSRYKLAEGQEAEVVRNLRRWNVRYLFMIGGNDTSETILRVARQAEKEAYDLRAVHIPKTIDNDLMETDHCPGYGSIARFLALATQEAGLDTKAMRHVDPVKIIEVMGRNSGWIVAASSLLKKKESDPPHLLLFPEIPFVEKDFLTHVDRILTRVGYCIVVISETIRDRQGNRLGARREGVIKDPFGHQYVDGAAFSLARMVENRFKVRARFDKPGTLARMSMPYLSPCDQEEAYEAGRRAVLWTLKGMSRVMVGFVRRKGKYRIDYRPVPLERIPGRERYLPKSFFNGTRTGMSPAFHRYALPLIGGNLPDFSPLKAVSPPQSLLK